MILKKQLYLVKLLTQPTQLGFKLIWFRM